MRYRIVYTVLLPCKNCAEKDDVVHKSIKGSCLWDDSCMGSIILSSALIFQFVCNECIFYFKCQAGDEEVMYSLEGRSCLLEELFYVAAKTMELAIEDDPWEICWDVSALAHLGLRSLNQLITEHHI